MSASRRPRAAPGLVEALGLGPGPELVAIVGGGGKTTLLFALGRALPGRVVLTTTTRIFAAQIALAERWCSLADPDARATVAGAPGDVLVVGAVEGERALGVPPELPAELLAMPGVAHVVVEADGSRMRPAKAPADHEPVVPEACTVVVAVAGLDALERPLREAVHRPDRVAALTGCAPHGVLSPEALGALLASPEGGMKGRPAGARGIVLLNKAETPARRAAAHRAARAALATGRVDRVVIGALREPGTRLEVRARPDPARGPDPPGGPRSPCGATPRRPASPAPRQKATRMAAKAETLQRPAVRGVGARPARTRGRSARGRGGGISGAGGTGA